MFGSSPRPVRFIANGPSLQTPIVGSILRGFGVIPIWRPQDLATKGQSGSVTVRVVLRLIVWGSRWKGHHGDGDGDGDDGDVNDAIHAGEQHGSL